MTTYSTISQAARDVKAGQDARVDIIGRLEFIFQTITRNLEMLLHSLVHKK